MSLVPLYTVEYQIIDISSYSTRYLQNGLNDLGKDGWEFAGMLKPNEILLTRKLLNE